MRIGTKILAGLLMASVLSGAGGATGQAVPHRAVSVAAGIAHSCALTRAGAVWCWGYDGHDELGDGQGPEDSLSPVAVVGLGSRVVALSAGTRHSCAVTHAGRVRCWGAAYSGALGNGPPARHGTPVTVSGLSGVKSVAAGADAACALTRAGAVWCWGANTSGQAGDGTTEDRFTPVPVSGLSSGVSAISHGYSQACALLDGGTVKCWGAGFGTTPTDVPGLTGVSAISSGCALVAGGSVRCFSARPRMPPVEVQALRGATAIAGYPYYGCALTRGGRVACWGANNHGQLGDGTRKDRAAAAPVVGLHRGAVAIATGAFHACAATAWGAVKCWGVGGPLGDGTKRDRRKPVGVLDFGVRAAVALVSARMPVRADHNATVELRCGSALRCSGAVALSRRGAVIARRHSFSIARGRVKGILVRLTPRAFRLLRLERRLTVRLALVWKQPDGGTTRLSRAVVLVAPRPSGS